MCCSQALGNYTRKNKKQLSLRLLALEEELQKERRERVSMEEALTRAYSSTIRQLVEQQEEKEAAAAAEAGRHGNRGLLGRSKRVAAT